MCPLEQAIGIPALIALRDYLLSRHPVEKPALSGFDHAWDNAAPSLPKVEHKTWHELGLDRFYCRQYSRMGKKWWRIMDRVTDCVAVWAPPGSAKPIPQEMFLTWDEAAAQIPKLLKLYE